MAENEGRNLILAFIIFTGIILGGMSLINLWRADSPNYIDNTKYAAFNQSFIKYDELNRSTTELNDLTTNPSFWDLAKETISSIGVAGRLLMVGWGGLNKILIGFGFILDAFTSLSIFGIPEWVSVLITMSITIVIVYIIIKAAISKNL